MQSIGVSLINTKGSSAGVRINPIHICGRALAAQYHDGQYLSSAPRSDEGHKRLLLVALGEDYRTAKEQLPITFSTGIDRCARD